MSTVPNGDGRQYDAADIQIAITHALKANDMPAVAGLLRMLAVRDPDAAALIYDMVQLVAMRSESAS